MRLSTDFEMRANRLLVLVLLFSFLGMGCAQQIDYVTQLKHKPQIPVIQFVSPGGNDSNSGLNWSEAKFSCAAAVSALGSTGTSIIFLSPSLTSSDCIASTGSATGINGYIWAPTRIYVGPSAQATSGSTGVDSGRLHLVGSVWNGSAAVDDFWDIYTNSFPGAFADGSNLIISHSSVENGSGRVLHLSDLVVGNPRDATPSLNSNSFAFDNQGAYSEGGTQAMLWEMANTVNQNGGALNTLIFRQNFVPIFNSAAAGAQGEFALGGSGTLGVSGNYSGPPKWLFTNLRGSSFNTMTLEHSATAQRTITFPDASGTLMLNGAGANGQIIFNNFGTLTGDNNLFWDNVNKRLGIGTSSPIVPVDIKSTGSGGWPQFLIENTASGGGNAYIGMSDTGNGAGGNKFLISSTSTSTAALLSLDLTNTRVGVGTASPAFGLDVNGRINSSTAYVYNGSVASAGKYLKSDGVNGYRDSNGAASGTGSPATCSSNQFLTAFTLNADAAPTDTCGHPAVIWPGADSTTAVQIDKADGSTNVVDVDTTNSRVGIGTTSPGNNLDIGFNNGSNDNNGMYLSNTNANGFGGSYSIRVTQTGPGTYTSSRWYSENQGTGASAGGFLRFQTADTTQTLQDRLAIDNAGKVGIGTTSPQQRLHVVVPDIDIPDLRLERASENFVDFVFSGGAVSGDALDLIFQPGNNESLGYLFQTMPAAAGSPSAALAINRNGNVGIGTTSPSVPLHVQANGSSAQMPGTITGAAVAGDVNTILNSATAQSFAVIGVNHGTSDTAGAKAFGGWFKSSASTNTSTEVALHSEVADASSGSTLIEGIAGGSTKFTWSGDGGLQIGSPTGGSKGAGTINVATDIFKNGTAYTNPDYVLELWSKHRIEKFKNNPGAAGYRLMTLQEVEKYAREHSELPRVAEASGIFSRSDVLLEKVEELYVYVFQLQHENSRLQRRVRVLERKMRTQNGTAK